MNRKRGKYMKRERDKTAVDHLGYSLYAFGGLGMEIVLIAMETKIMGNPQQDWSAVQNISHWCLTCLIWGITGFLLVKHLDQEPRREKIHKITLPDYAAVFLTAIVSILYTSFVWNGFKPAVEFAENGLLMFFFQYVYYGFEALLLIVLAAHGQKAFESWLGRESRLPAGGILLALTWGLVHVFTQGAQTGIYAGIQALLYGMVYLLLHKNFKASYLAVTVMFML